MWLLFALLYNNILSHHDNHRTKTMTDPVTDPNEKALMEFYKVHDPTKASIELVRRVLTKYKDKLPQARALFRLVISTRYRFDCAVLIEWV